MIIRWDNPEKTYVRVEIMGAVYQIPAADGNADWLDIKSKVDAGSLAIGAYEPPVLEEGQ